MKKIIFILLLSLLASCKNEIKTTDTEINLLNSSKRNICIHDTIFYVENDLKTISASTDNQVIWKNKIISDSLKEWENFVGKPAIRHIKFNENSNTLSVVCGKHSFYTLNPKNGKIIKSGSD